MKYRVVSDSCVDFHSRIVQGERVPFSVRIDGETYVDQGDEVTGQLNRIGFLAKSIQTACPSPGDFIEALGDAKKAFVVTISSQLSGAYEAAVAAKEHLMEQLREREIHIFDSKTACAGETMVLMKLQQLLAEDQPFVGVVEKMNEYIANLRTLFVLESLETLVANGRVKPIEGFAIKALKIVPIMGADGEGRIEMKGVMMGRKRAFARLVEMIGDSKKDLRECVLGITHVNALEKAQALRDQICAMYPFKDVMIFEASGLSSVYASNGGIVVAY